MHSSKQKHFTLSIPSSFSLCLELHCTRLIINVPFSACTFLCLSCRYLLEGKHCLSADARISIQQLAFPHEPLHSSWRAVWQAQETPPQPQKGTGGRGGKGTGVGMRVSRNGHHARGHRAALGMGDIAHWSEKGTNGRRGKGSGAGGGSHQGQSGRTGIHVWKKLRRGSEQPFQAKA